MFKLKLGKLSPKNPGPSKPSEGGNKLEAKKSSGLLKSGKFPKISLGSFKSSRAKIAWGIEIGDNELIAAKVRSHDGKLIVLAAERIGFSVQDQSAAQDQSVTKGLSLAKDQSATPDKSKLIEEAVNTFIEHNPLEKTDKIVVSISGRVVLSRFVSLPPMKKGRIGEAIKYELRKQMPFEPREIVWDSYQFEDTTKGGKGGKGVDVGIFATKKENIYGLLPSLTPLKMNIEAIQTTPVVIYNLIRLCYAPEKEIVVLNVEKESTDFIVVGKAKFWNRSISVSEINMDFVREIQRSMGYYVSLTKDVMPEEIFLIGEVFEDKEKVKLVEENLTGKVTTLNLLDNITISKDVNPSILNERTVNSFGTAFGLALQGLDLGKININFLPFDYIRERLVPKRKALVGIITLLIILSLLTQGIKEYLAWKEVSVCESTISSTLNEAAGFERIYKKIVKDVEKKEKKLQAIESIGSQGRFWIEVIPKIIDAMPEKVYLSNMVSGWDLPYAEDKKEKAGKKKSGRKERRSSRKAEKQKKVLIMNVKGESYNPRMSYIEEMVKKPLEELILSDQQGPAFRNVEIVKGSIRHVSLSTSDQSEKLITFRMRWIVNTIN